MSVGANIRRIRKQRGLTILEVATEIGSDVGNISRLERGVQGYSDDTLNKLARALGVSVGDFFESESNVSEAPIRGMVPLISWVQAGDWCNIEDPYSKGDAEEWIACPKKHGPRTYALRVRGLSMQDPGNKPSFDDGDIIFVDPDVAAIHKSLVIARLDDSAQATFKRLLIEGDERMLIALNPAWPQRIIRFTERASICGVIIGKYVDV